METTIDKLHRIHDKFKDKIQGSFHTMLWKILINENFKGLKVALVNIYEVGGGSRLGIATQGESGYIPCPCGFSLTFRDAEIQSILDELNKELFNISPKQAMDIKLSSMRGPREIVDLPSARLN